MNGRLGRYELLSRLGAGGTAEVWRARLDGPHGFVREVVLKRLRPHLAVDRAFVSRLRAEARLVAVLDHANVAQIYEVFEASGETVLAMEYVRGCDLLDLLRAHDRLGTRMPISMAAYIAREIARGLAAAHAHRDAEGRPSPIVHRDVNPANIMIGTDGSVRLIDFGFAKAAQDRSREQTATGVLFGKQGYIAPEQLADVGRRAEPDPRCDQFSLGVVLHEMLTGRRLAYAAGVDRLAEPPSRSNPDVPPELDVACRRMLAAVPDARYPDCRTVAELLDDVACAASFGNTQMSAHLAAHDLPRATTPPLGDANRETEDAGAGVLGDTIVEPRSGDSMGQVAPPRRLAWALGAAAAVIALLVGIEIRLHGARAVAPTPREAPTAVTSPFVTAEDPPAAEPAAPPVSPTKPIERRRAPARSRPQGHHDGARPTPPPGRSFDGPLREGTIINPFP